MYDNGVDPESYTHAQAIVENSISVLCQNESLTTILESLQDHTDFLYAHSLGVSLIGSMIAKSIGWTSTRTLTKISMCGLLHDVGKKEIPKELLQKKRMLLTADEIKLLETHTMRGLEILRQVQSMPEELTQVAIQHHEDCMALGYPMRLTKSHIIPLARLITVANEYCNLAIKNPNSDGMPPREAVLKLAQHFGARLDAEFLVGLGKIFQIPADDITQALEKSDF
jgi:putative nucleotidyltransferase with HDIG domain